MTKQRNCLSSVACKLPSRQEIKCKSSDEALSTGVIRATIKLGLLDLINNLVAAR